jgi:tRNA nucleotidyltransferase/poly(A) polymerase
MLFPDHLDIPREVRRIAETLEAAGFDTWCVGGAVRDNLLGEVNNDFDLATAARPEDVQRLFTRTIPIGVDHGTVAVLDRHRKPHEVTTFRRDVKTDGRHAVVEFGASIDEDLARRDFTINAIAYHPLESEWRDPYDGHRDLERGVLRSVGDPSQRFREDYLRILRALSPLRMPPGRPPRPTPRTSDGFPPNGCGTSGSRGWRRRSGRVSWCGCGRR